MTSERNSLRDLEIYEKRVRGATLAVLAEEYGLDDSRISNICTEVRRMLPDRTREELIRITTDQLEFLREKVIELVNMEGAPVTAGQHGDILREPSENGDGEIVRDYSLRVKGIAEAHRLNVTMAKRLGLDAPTQTETKASVQYEIVGIDPEALT